MKAMIMTLMLLTLSVSAHAEDTRTYKKVSPIEAVVTIKTEDAHYTQVAPYVDGVENEQFLSDLLKDPKSPLAKLAREIEMENCETTSTPDNSWIDGCGEVTLTTPVRTSFGRGGWASASASYTVFVGFTMDGTGRFFEVSHTIQISEGAEAQTDITGEYNGYITKVLSLDNVKKLDK